MKFRKKVSIEAEQFFEGQNPETYPPEIFFDKNAGQYAIKTLEGSLLVSDGDWIITGIQREKYVCKPDIFTALGGGVRPKRFGRKSTSVAATPVELGSPRSNL